LVAVVLALSSLFTSHPAQAASVGPMPSHIQSGAQVPPDCTGSVRSAPTYQSDLVDTNVSVNVTWSCEAYEDVVVNISWGDGNSASYTCWVNCGGGTTQLYHVYMTIGDYHPYIWRGGLASGSTSVEVDVY
jgi:hypothetical protein